MPTERRHSLEIFFRRRDNAEHFHGKNFELACAQIGTRVEYAPTRTPQYKEGL
jgi:hypothetical protein